MAMGKCKECDKEVSMSAEICPHCGIKDPTTPFGVKIFTFVLFFIFIVWMLVQCTADEPVIELTKEEITKNINYFNANRSKIMLSIDKSFSSKKYKDVIDKSEKYITSNDEELKQVYSKAKKAIKRKEKIEESFSQWDGSHRGLERHILKSMNDPDSYKHMETNYWDRGNHLRVRTTYRGKNLFGGMVINWILAKVDINGNVIEIIDTGTGN